jgi:hypothetical protein
MLRHEHSRGISVAKCNDFTTFSSPYLAETVHTLDEERDQSRRQSADYRFSLHVGYHSHSSGSRSPAFYFNATVSGTALTDITAF